MKMRLFRRHTDVCNAIHSPHLAENALDECGCNLGYKGYDSNTRKFRRLMFVPPIEEVRAAWRALDQIEQGKRPVITLDGDRAEPPRLRIRTAFDRYLEFVRLLRNVKESSIYAMFRPVGNAIVRLADSKGVKYVDELRGDFGPEILASYFQHLSVNVRGNYRRVVKDFFRVAKTNAWTQLDLAARIEEPARGKRRTAPMNPTEPFDLTTELQRIMESVPSLELRLSERSPWKDHLLTARAFILLLRYTGLRISDALLFEPRSLEQRIVRDKEGNERKVYVRWVRKQKKTDTPVFVIIPFKVGELIREAPRLSEERAFCPAGRSTGKQFRSWLNNTSRVLFPPLERLSGVQHIHAHRFRDTFAVELWRKTKDINFVSRALGHSSVLVTINHYSHFLREDQDEAIKTMLEGGMAD